MLQKSRYTRPYLFAIVMAVLLICSTAWTMLSTFVFAREEVPVETPVATPTPSMDAGEPAATPNTPVISTDTQYDDGNIKINIETVKQEKLTYYVADIQLSDVKYLKTAFAQGKFGRNYTQTTSQMAQENNAILAISGDYYGFRDNGIIIRNGTLYRDKSADESLVVMSNGDFKIVKDSETSGEQLKAEGAIHSFSFGPTLVENGQYAPRTSKVNTNNPRTGIGQVGPLHYVFIVVDGRGAGGSEGLKMQDFAQLFVDRGCSVAYNLDGGGTSTMWMNGKVVNNPSYGEERRLSDIIYIGK